MGVRISIVFFFPFLFFFFSFSFFILFLFVYLFVCLFLSQWVTIPGKHTFVYNKLLYRKKDYQANIGKPRYAVPTVNLLLLCLQFIIEGNPSAGKRTLVSLCAFSSAYRACKIRRLRDRSKACIATLTGSFICLTWNNIFIIFKNVRVKGSSEMNISKL